MAIARQGLLAFLGLFGFAGGFFAKYHWHFIAAGVIGVAILTIAWLLFRSPIVYELK